MPPPSPPSLDDLEVIVTASECSRLPSRASQPKQAGVSCWGPARPLEVAGSPVRSTGAARGRAVTIEDDRIWAAQLRYQAAIRGSDQEAVAREAGLSAATVSRAMRGMPVRGLTALCLVQVLSRAPALPELIDLVAAADGSAVGPPNLSA